MNAFLERAKRETMEQSLRRVVPKESAATRKQRGWRERFNFCVIARQVWRVPDSTLSTRRPRSIRSFPCWPSTVETDIPRSCDFPADVSPHSAVPRSVPFHPLFSPSDFFSLSFSLPLLINLRISVHKRRNDWEIVRSRASILIERDNYQGLTILFIDGVIESSLLFDKFF